MAAAPAAIAIWSRMRANSCQAVGWTVLVGAALCDKRNSTIKQWLMNLYDTDKDLRQILARRIHDFILSHPGGIGIADPREDCRAQRKREFSEGIANQLLLLIGDRRELRLTCALAGDSDAPRDVLVVNTGDAAHAKVSKDACPPDAALLAINPKVNTRSEPVVVVLAGLKCFDSRKDRLADPSVAAVISNQGTQGIA